mmetsp:Transcript_22469/g.55398  ORF Transcript_22469/g.55398 Transcript_22469/m.55398 type:complete len:264 (-) Transcript_22469:234-1025(-)
MGDEHEREPCPHRIVDDLGGAFAFGAVGGSVFHSFKGARNSPRGERFVGAIQAVQANARRLGGSFAHWGGLFSVFDCTAAYVRGTEDPYNSIMAGFCTGATLAARGGANAAFKSGMIGGILLAIMEGLNIAIQKQMGAIAPPEPIVVEDAKKGKDGEPAEVAEAPWWVKYLPGPPEEKPTTDFSDPKEMAAAPGFGDGKDDFSKSEKKWSGASPLEADVDARKLFLLIRGHAAERAPMALDHEALLANRQRLLGAIPGLPTNA